MAEAFILLALILLNGFFSMCEIALVSARKSRLEQLANEGNQSAAHALELVQKPEVFLSTVQVGITLIAIITGLYSGEKFGKDLEPLIAQIPLLAPYAEGISTGLVVIVVTFLSILFGELIPKRLGLLNAERMALIAAPIMGFLSKLSFPIIWLLNNTTALIFRVFNVKNTKESVVTEEEIKALLNESAEGGEIDETEQEIIERVFHLGDRSITSLMTHRSDITWLELEGTIQDLLDKLYPNPHSVYPLCKGSIDEIAGIIQLKEIVLAEKNTPLKDFLRPAVFVPENISPYKLMEKFRSTKVHSAFIVDEYGTLQGMVTLNDILEAIVGDIPDENSDEYEIIQRKDGSFLADAQVAFYDFLARFDCEDWLDDEAEYDTLGGFIIHELERIPSTGDMLDWRDFSFEIIDMDGARIDKILIQHKAAKPNDEAADDTADDAASDQANADDTAESD